MIDPLPHQRIAVYDHMLPQPRLRFLLADEPGAGKTIMAGLYIREMLARRLLRRVLIVPPAGLVGNWERELKTLFGLDFRIVSGADAKSGNPFVGSGSDLVIISVDTLASERPFARLQEPTVEPYDLCIFDECHKLGADRQPDFTIRKTDRYRVAEALAGIQLGDPRWSLDWAATHLLLLTATPHMGKDFPYYALWRLLEPEVLSTLDAFNAYPADARRRHFIRRTKEEMVSFDGKRIYPSRVSDTLSYDLSQGEINEQALYDRTTAYIETYYNRARILNRSAARLAMSVFQLPLGELRPTPSFGPSSAAWRSSTGSSKRSRRAESPSTNWRRCSGSSTTPRTCSRKRPATRNHPRAGKRKTRSPKGRHSGVSSPFPSRNWSSSGNGSNPCSTWRSRWTPRAMSPNLISSAKTSTIPESRDEKRIIFTEHRDTLVYLVRRLEGLGFTGQIARIHGSMDFRDREAQIEFFRKKTNQGGALYMVCTDAAGEGLNMQFAWRLLNWDIPWNPARLEQRMGRIHRYKQMHDPVYIINLVAGKTREGRVMKTLLEKLERIRKELGNDKVFDVIGRLFEGVSIKEYMEKAVASEGRLPEQVCRVLDGTLTKEQVEALEARERPALRRRRRCENPRLAMNEKAGPRKLAADHARLCTSLHREVGTAPGPGHRRRPRRHVRLHDAETGRTRFPLEPAGNLPAGPPATPDRPQAEGKRRRAVPPSRRASLRPVPSPRLRDVRRVSQARGGFRGPDGAMPVSLSPGGRVGVAKG